MHQGIYHCRFPQGVVVLDLVPDRYMLLRHAAADRYIDVVNGQAGTADKKWLLERGLSDGPCFKTGEATQGFVMPTSSAVDDGPSDGSHLSILRAITRQLDYRRRLKKHALHRLLSQLELKRPHTPSDDVHRALTVAGAFDRSKRYLPSQDQCLPRALAMTELLFGRGINAKLIFGVTMPFSAHCWVQLNDIVLTDPLDRVLPFRPIMVMS